MSVDEIRSAVEQAVKGAGLATKEVLTFEEAAQFTGLSKSCLYKKTSGREIPHYKSGKLCYFNREELQAWLMRHRVSTTDEIAGKAQTYCMQKGGRR